MVFKALVTGHTGFIGSHLFDTLKNHSQFSTVVGASRSGRWFPINHIISNDKNYDCCVNLMYEMSVKHLFEHFQPNIIFHLAGNASVKSHPDDVLEKNLITTKNLLKYCPENCKIILASSATVYGNLSIRKFPGDIIYACIEDDKTEPNSAYGMSKLSAELLLKTYRNHKNIDYVILRYIANVGSNSTHGVVHDFVKKLSSFSSPNLEMLGDFPGSKKPYIHVRDTVEATIFAALNDKMKNKTFNVSTPDSLSIDTLSTIIMKAMHISKKKVWLGESANWKGDNPVVSVNSNKLKNMGWQPQYKTSVQAIEQAIKDIVK